MCAWIHILYDVNAQKGGWQVTQQIVGTGVSEGESGRGEAVFSFAP